MVEIIRERPELAVWTVLILAVAVCYIAKVLCGHWRSVRQAELEAVLKEQMIQRGMSAAEMGQVMEVSLASVDSCPEAEIRRLPARRPSARDQRWVWLAVGVPVALFLLCGGFMAMGTFAVVASDTATSITVDEAVAVPDNGR